MNKFTTNDINKWLENNQKLIDDMASAFEEPIKVIKQSDVVEDTEWKKYYYSEGGNETEYNRRRLPKNRFIRARYDAKRRASGAKEWSITLEEYLEITKNKCTYCNISIANSSGSGLDRVNNDLGYISGNVVACCVNCNRKRGAGLMSSEEFKRQTKLNGQWIEDEKEKDENKC